MTRGRTTAADGWITVGVRLRASDVARLDAGRGAISRSEWLRNRALAALAEMTRAEQAVADAGLDAAEEEMRLTPAEVRQINAALCPHGYPDVVYKLGQRVCRKCK